MLHTCSFVMEPKVQEIIRMCHGSSAGTKEVELQEDRNRQTSSVAMDSILMHVEAALCAQRTGVLHSHCVAKDGSKLIFL